MQWVLVPSQQRLPDVNGSEMTFRRPFRRLALVACLAALPGALAGEARPLRPVTGLTAVGHDSRIDLRWKALAAEGFRGYRVYRATAEAGPFARRGGDVHHPNVYSDFLEQNGQTFYYRVTAIYRGGAESRPSAVVSARSRAMSDEQLLTSVQEATFRYFWDWGHPDCGLARERSRSRPSANYVCSSGGTGVGLMAIMIGAERGFVSRAAAATRIQKILTFLQERAPRYHGAWSHWIDARTGRTIPFSKYDDGGDLVETAFLVQGMLTVRRYFNGRDPVETDIRRRATRLWREVDWRWYLREPGGRTLLWHWSPKHGWKIDLRIGGIFSECLIAYLLAIASPTHPIPADCYEKGWVRNAKRYVNGKTYYGHKQWVGLPMGGPLFFTHYSFLGFDPRGKRDRYCDYFANSRNITRIHRAYCIANPGKHKGYGENCWGLTASRTPGGYQAHAPGRRDNGTIAPTAAISAMPYTPKESLGALKHFYHAHGRRLWGEFGFRDAFNLSRDWFADGYLAIDQGPIVIMIENHRTGLPWRMFMSNPEIAPMLRAIGWKTSPAPGETRR